MEQRGNDAASRDVPIEHKREECAQRMEQRGNDAALRDAPHMPRKEEFVGDMAQKESRQTTTRRFNQMLSLLPFHPINQLFMKMTRNLIVGFGDLVE